MTLPELHDLWHGLTGGYVSIHSPDDSGLWCIVLNSDTLFRYERSHVGDSLDEAIDSAVLAIAAMRGKRGA